MTIEKYIEEIDKDGLENVWDSIIKNGLSEVQNAGELYEIGLAHINKKEKKESGKYFTPFDVADVMSDWFDGWEAIINFLMMVTQKLLALLNLFWTHPILI